MQTEPKNIELIQNSRYYRVFTEHPKFISLIHKIQFEWITNFGYQIIFGNTFAIGVYLPLQGTFIYFKVLGFS